MAVDGYYRPKVDTDCDNLNAECIQRFQRTFTTTLPLARPA